MGGTLKPAEARRRFDSLQKGLSKLLQVYPEALPAKVFFDGNVSHAARYRVMARLTEGGFIDKVGRMHFTAYRAAPPLRALVANDERLSKILWPGSEPIDASPEESAQTVFDAPADEHAVAKGWTQHPSHPYVMYRGQEVMLKPQNIEPPPVIEGLLKPPADASDAIVKEWLYTLLHAQTENLIYMREKIDLLEGKLGRAVEILEKLL